MGRHVILWFRYGPNCDDLNDRSSIISACKNGLFRKTIFKTHRSFCCKDGIYTTNIEEDDGEYVKNLLESFDS